MKTVSIDDINYVINWTHNEDIWLEPEGINDWIMLWVGGDYALCSEWVNTDTYNPISLNEYRYDTIEQFVSENRDQFIKIQQS